MTKTNHNILQVQSNHAFISCSFTRQQEFFFKKKIADTYKQETILHAIKDFKFPTNPSSHSSIINHLKFTLNLMSTKLKMWGKQFSTKTSNFEFSEVFLRPCHQIHQSDTTERFSITNNPLLPKNKEALFQPKDVLPISLLKKLIYLSPK